MLGTMRIITIVIIILLLMIILVVGIRIAGIVAIVAVAVVVFLLVCRVTRHLGNEYLCSKESDSKEARSKGSALSELPT